MKSYSYHTFLLRKKGFRRELKKWLKLCFNCFKVHSETFSHEGVKSDYGENLWDFGSVFWYDWWLVLLLIQSYLGIPLQIWAKKIYDQRTTFGEKRPQSGLIDPFLTDFKDFSSFLAVKSPRSGLTDSVHYISW